MEKSIKQEVDVDSNLNRIHHIPIHIYKHVTT